MERLARQAEGNPLFLRELVAAVRDHADVETLPDSLDALLTVRLDRLGPRDRDLVRRAAVLGPYFREADVALVLGDSTTVPGASSWARLSEFVRVVDEEHVAFSHALLRDAAYAALPFRLRRELHGRVADALVGQPDADDAALSYHFFAARRWSEAWQTARNAGESAMTAHAPVEAAALLESSAAELPGTFATTIAWSDRAEPRFCWHAHTRSVGRSTQPSAAYAGVTAGSDDPLLKARSLVQQAWLAERKSRLQAGCSACQGCAAMAGDDPGERRRGARECLAAALTVEGTCWMVTGRHDRAATVLRRAVDEAEAAGDLRTVAHAGSILDWSLGASGDRTSGEHLRRALQIYHELDDLGGQATCWTNLGRMAYLRGDWERADLVLPKGPIGPEPLR